VDNSDLYTLATRLLPRRTRPGAPGAEQLQLHAGQLPPSLLFDPPIPPDCRIIGSAVEGPFVTVLLDTELTPKRALSFYSESLTGSGWTMLDTGRSVAQPRRGGKGSRGVGTSQVAHYSVSANSPGRPHTE